MDHGLVTLDPSTTGITHTPLDYAPFPDSPIRELFDADLIDRHLDRMAAAQLADGAGRSPFRCGRPAPSGSGAVISPSRRYGFCAPTAGVDIPAAPSPPIPPIIIFTVAVHSPARIALIVGLADLAAEFTTVYLDEASSALGQLLLLTLAILH